MTAHNDRFLEFPTRPAQATLHMPYLREGVRDISSSTNGATCSSRSLQTALHAGMHASTAHTTNSFDCPSRLQQVFA